MSYDELAAFVDTSVAAIKNPGFRPRVFARGPNGEDRRSILDLPASRTALVVDEPGPVRLAVRDLDGLRWLDAHVEAGSAVRLWFPDALRPRLEVDRLSLRRQGVHVDARLRLPEQGAAPVRLAALPPSDATVAMRGAGEIFEALFARPFGPAALAAWQGARPEQLEQLLGLEPVPLVPARQVGEVCEDVARPAALVDRGRLFTAVVRAGATLPSATADGRLSIGRDRSIGLGASLAAGVELNPQVAVEAEVGYQRLGATSDFFSYPNPASPYTPVVGTRIDLQLMPMSLDLRMQLPGLRPCPYLLVGGGAAAVWSVLDPPDFNATLRASGIVPLLHAAVGLQVDLSDQAFLGVEARYTWLGGFRAFDSTLHLGGVGTSFVAGVRR